MEAHLQGRKESLFEVDSSTTEREKESEVVCSLYVADVNVAKDTRADEEKEETCARRVCVCARDSFATRKRGKSEKNKKELDGSEQESE